MSPLVPCCAQLRRCATQRVGGGWGGSGKGTTPSPGTRIATAPATDPIRGKPAPDHGSRGAPFGMDTQRSAPTQ
jgi:hypothetical protein